MLVRDMGGPIVHLGRAMTRARCILTLPGHHRPSQILLHEQLAANNHPSEGGVPPSQGHHSPHSTQELIGNE